MQSYLSLFPTCVPFRSVPLVAVLSCWFYFRFSSYLNFNDELFVVFPVGWNRGTSRYFRLGKWSPAQQMAELSNRVISQYLEFSIKAVLPNWPVIFAITTLCSWGCFTPFPGLLSAFNLPCLVRWSFGSFFCPMLAFSWARIWTIDIAPQLPVS